MNSNEWTFQVPDALWRASSRSSYVFFPLTPALSPRERKNCRQLVGESGTVGIFARPTLLFPAREAQRRPGVSPAPVGGADATTSLAWTRKLGRRDARPTLAATRFKGARRAKSSDSSLPEGEGQGEGKGNGPVSAVKRFVHRKRQGNRFHNSPFIISTFISLGWRRATACRDVCGAD